MFYCLMLCFIFSLHCVRSQNGPNVVLTIRPVRFENHGEMDLHGRACNSEENCEVRVRYCYAILDSTTVNPNKDQDFCQFAEPVELHPFTVEAAVNPQGGPAYYSHNFHWDENSQTKFLYNKNTKVAIWLDATHYITSMDQFNETRTEHRMVAETYHEIEIAENLLPNEDMRTFNLIQEMDFKEGLHKLHGWIEFTFRAQVKCLHFWRGCTCQKFCMSTERHSCDGNGNHVCNFHWYPSSSDDDDCSVNCKAHDPGMYCNEHGEYKCFEGYQAAQGNTPTEFIPCEQITCDNAHIGCPATQKCVDSAEYNSKEQGFYKCE